MAFHPLLALDIHFNLYFWHPVLVITPWKCVGLTGSAIFGLRFLIQWIASERQGKSIIPFGFWECSALGSFLMITYFAFGKTDIVGLLNTLMPFPIYLRNLYLRHRERRALQREPEAAGASAKN